MTHVINYLPLQLHWYCSVPEFDVSELETLFSAIVPKKAASKEADKKKAAGSKPEKIHLVMYIELSTYLINRILLSFYVSFSFRWSFSFHGCILNYCRLI